MALLLEFRAFLMFYAIIMFVMFVRALALLTAHEDFTADSVMAIILWPLHVMTADGRSKLKKILLPSKPTTKESDK
jgi:hypothetical protein